MVLCVFVAAASVMVAPAVLRQWDDSRCTTRLPAGGDEGAAISTEFSLWPPGTRCVYQNPDGRTVEVFQPSLSPGGYITIGSVVLVAAALGGVAVARARHVRWNAR